MIAHWICPSTSVTYVKLSIFISATCGEYAISSPKMLVIMPSEHLSCPALTMLICFFFFFFLCSRSWFQTAATATEQGAARLVFACGRNRCSVELLNTLHWLQFKDRICFKIMLYVYKCIMNVAPSYLCDLSPCLVTLFSENRPRLRSSSDTTKLLVPRSRKRAGDHYFVVTFWFFMCFASLFVRFATSYLILKQFSLRRSLTQKWLCRQLLQMLLQKNDELMCFNRCEASRR